MSTLVSRWPRVLYLVLVGLLPLHTVFLRAGIAIKPWLVLLAAVVLLDMIGQRGLPWPRRASLGGVAFLAATLVSWPTTDASSSFWRLWFALAAGVLLLLTTSRHAVSFTSLLRVVFWSGAAMGVTAFILSLVTNGVFGESAVSGVNDVYLIARVNKPAYLGSGFIALTNWHQDPGYSALWTNVWLVFSAVAWSRGAIRAPRWVGPLVLGGLAMASLLTFSRTGWLGLVSALIGLSFLFWRSPEYDLGKAARLLLYGLLAGAGLVSVLIVTDKPGVGGDMLVALEFRVVYLIELGAIDTGEAGVIDPELIVPDNRVEVWSEYLDRFADNPVRGIGLGTGWSEPGLQEPHNLWIELIAETGIVGLIGFLALLASLGWPPSGEVGVALVVVGLATLTQTVLFEPALWFVLGWLVASIRQGTDISLDSATTLQEG